MIEVKICENCKHRNPVNAVECEECGYDLTFAYPQKIDENNLVSSEVELKENTLEKNDTLHNWEIILLSDNKIKQTINGEISLGRDCDLFKEQFNSSNYTSRVHAKIRVFEGQLQIMDASTNGTFINEKRISKMEWVNVSEGSIIKFADVQFSVRRA